MRSKRTRIFLNLGLSLSLTGVMFFGAIGRASAAGIIYVNAAASGANDGTSWTNAYTELGQALTNAAIGDEIWVAAGTYQPQVATDIADPRTKTFSLKNGVALYGGFAGTETLRTQRNPALHMTVLSGDIGVSGDASDNAYHVVYASGVDLTAVLDGFTVRLGNANGTSYPNFYGGGMFSANSSPTLSNLSFSSNSGNGGGGMTDLFSAPMKIKYDPKVLRVVEVKPGGLLGGDGKRVVFSENTLNDAGESSVLLNRVPGAGGVSGSGVLVVITFQAVAPGSTGVSLSDLTLRDATLQTRTVQLPRMAVNVK